MIGLSRLKRAIEDVPTGGMQTGDPKVRLKLCDAQRIEVEFNAIIAERDSALAQNAELVAQVEALRESIYNTIRVCNNNSGSEPSLGVYHRALNNAADVWRKTPAQHLRDRNAEVGRAGFVAGVQYAHKRPDVVLPKVIEMVAWDYFERVKDGEL